MRTVDEPEPHSTITFGRISPTSSKSLSRQNRVHRPVRQLERSSTHQRANVDVRPKLCRALLESIAADLQPVQADVNRREQSETDHEQAGEGTDREQPGGTVLAAGRGRGNDHGEQSPDRLAQPRREPNAFGYLGARDG